MYSTLVPRPAGDIGWRLLHGAVSTGVHLARFTPIPEACPFCGVREDLAHAYLECARLQPLFRLLRNLLLRFWLHFSPHLFLFAHPVRGPTKSRDLLVNLLLALAKVSIYKTRRRMLDEGSSVTVGPISDPPRVTDPGRVPLGSVRWLPQQLWGAVGAVRVLCSVSPSGLLVLNL
ncbi:hypothetical protein G0U57_018056 [Chelydra serpentina]|uniref:Reverse transcriptase zinc-binding domain-containing protein n=1 Tax=Chelydra serpentina TaxID=8475 RepID=A0A8T1SXG7_CHESE|nr:hypothetical protein G0U57_018056 [Chelydra serpentina]